MKNTNIGTLDKNWGNMIKTDYRKVEFYNYMENKFEKPWDLGESHEEYGNLKASPDGNVLVQYYDSVYRDDSEVYINLYDVCKREPKKKLYINYLVSFEMLSKITDEGNSDLINDIRQLLIWDN